MSLDAMVWAVKDAPVADVEEHAVLTVMADEADEAGCGVLLATATIAKRARISAKTAQRRIDDMLARGLLGLGDQSRAAYIRADRRPIVYDLLIPYSAYSDRAIARVNEARAGKSLPPITAENRPEIEPPPPPRRRSDLGTKRPEPDGVTTSPPVHGVTSSPAGLVAPHGVTSKSSDADAYHQVSAQMPGSRGDYQSPDPFDPVIDPPVVTTVRTSLGAEPKIAKGEGVPRFDDETRARLAAAAEQVLTLKPGWRADDVRTAMLAEIDAGRPPVVVADAVVRLAEDPASNSPGRLKHAGPWWNTDPQPTRVVTGSHRQCPRHRGELAHNCAGCKADEVAERADRAAATAVPPAPAEMSPTAAAAAASARAAAAAAAVAARRPSPKPRQATDAPAPTLVGAG